MAITILPELASHASTNFGANLGAGLNQSLMEMFDAKKKERQFESLSPLLKGQFGMNDETISALKRSGMEPKETLAFLKLLGEQQGAQRLSNVLGDLRGGGGAKRSIGNALSNLQEGPQSQQEELQEAPRSLTDMSSGEFDQYLTDQGLSPKAKEKAFSEWDRERKHSLEREKFDYQKQKDASKSIEKFETEARKQFDAANNIRSAIGEMKKIRQKGNLGVASPARALLSDEARSDIGAYDTYSSQLLNLFKGMFPRGITQGEFKTISSKWLPSSGNTDAKNEAIEKAYEDLANLLEKKFMMLDEVRNPDGSLPANAIQRVDQIMASEFKEMKEKLLSAPPPEFSKGQTFDKMPSASKAGKGAIIQDDKGTTYISDGKNWKKRKK